MARVIAFANPESRTGKTRSASHLCLELAGRGVAVLAIDLDPRAELTRSFGIDTERVELSLFDVMTRGADALSALRETDFGVDVLPATPELSLAEGLLVTRAGRESLLRTALAGLHDHYDTIVIDCPSSLGLLALNALAAADELVITSAGASGRAITALMASVEEIRAFVNPGLTLRPPTAR